MKKTILWIFACLFLAGCGQKPAPEAPTLPVKPTTEAPTEPTTEPTEPGDLVEEILSSMTLEEKVGQMFLARCDGSRAVEDAAAYHLGGYVLFGQDFEGETRESLGGKLASYQAAAQIPLLLAVDEEGGTVTRISRYSAFRDTPFPSPRQAREAGGLGWALVNEDEKARFLAQLGLNVNLGPVCDMAGDPGDFMYPRSLGLGPEDTGFFVEQTVKLMADSGVGSVLKHFPGYGSNADTHVGIARDIRSLEELESWDFIPFAQGIQAGADGVLVSHVVVEALDDTLPASLSPAVHGYLREEMGFSGVIVTDDLVMEAITQAYGAGQAAVMAVQAGNDLLCSTEYITQYEAVLAAAQEGRIQQSQLDDSVRRILRWKQELGLIGN